MVGQILLWIAVVLFVIVTLLLLMPVGVRVRYGQEELKLWFVIGPVRILHKQNEDKEKPKKKSDGFSIHAVLGRAEPEASTALGKFWSEMKLIFSIFGYLRPKIRIKRLELIVNFAGSSPITTAMAYGGAWAAIGGFLPIFEEAFILKKRNLDVTCDFSGEETTLEAKLDLSIVLGRLVLCLIRYGIGTSDKIETKH